MSTELAVQRRELMPAMSMQDATERYNEVVRFTKTLMKPGKDYGVIKGTDRPSLLKPGAEKLCSFFGLEVDFVIDEKVEDWKGGMFYYSYKSILSRNGRQIAAGIGSCNSKEKKYRWRRIPAWEASEADKASGKQIKQWGKVFYLVENDDIFSQVNTLQKMAQKRAMIAATLLACNASEFFTQDIEDMDLIDSDPFVGTQGPDPESTNGQPQSRPNGRNSRYVDSTTSQTEPTTPPAPQVEHDAFAAEWDRQVQERGFTVAAGRNALKATLAKHKMELKDTDAKWHEGILAALNAGKFDKLLDIKPAEPKKAPAEPAPTAPPSEAEQAEIALNEICDQDWDGFKHALRTLADADQKMTRTDFEGGLAKYVKLVLGKGGKEASITRDMKKLIYKAVREKRFNFLGGQIIPQEKA